MRAGQVSSGCDTSQGDRYGVSYFPGAMPVKASIDDSKGNIGARDKRVC